MRTAPRDRLSIGREVHSSIQRRSMFSVTTCPPGIRRGSATGAGANVGTGLGAAVGAAVGTAASACVGTRVDGGRFGFTAGVSSRIRGATTTSSGAAGGEFRGAGEGAAVGAGEFLRAPVPSRLTT